MKLIIMVTVTLTAFGNIFPAASFADEDKPHLCFSSLDTDENDQVTLEEFKAGYPKLGEDKFKELDKDSSGALDHDEYHDALGHGSLD